MNRMWYKSKTLWTNLIAVVGILVFGRELPVETVAIVLSVLNAVLRLITKHPIIWTD